MAQTKNLDNYEEEAFRNAVLIDGIHAQVKNITALNKEALPIYIVSATNTWKLSLLLKNTRCFKMQEKEN